MEDKMKARCVYVPVDCYDCLSDGEIYEGFCAKSGNFIFQGDSGDIEAFPMRYFEEIEEPDRITALEEDIAVIKKAVNQLIDIQNQKADTVDTNGRQFCGIRKLDDEIAVIKEHMQGTAPEPESPKMSEAKQKRIKELMSELKAICKDVDGDDCKECPMFKICESGLFLSNNFPSMWED